MSLDTTQANAVKEWSAASEYWLKATWWLTKKCGARLQEEKVVELAGKIYADTNCAPGRYDATAILVRYDDLRKDYSKEYSTESPDYLRMLILASQLLTICTSVATSAHSHDGSVSILWHPVLDTFGKVIRASAIPARGAPLAPETDPLPHEEDDMAWARLGDPEASFLNGLYTPTPFHDAQGNQHWFRLVSQNMGWDPVLNFVTSTFTVRYSHEKDGPHYKEDKLSRTALHEKLQELLLTAPQ